MFLLHELARRKEARIVVGHVNHGARGGESDKDQAMVEDMVKHLHLEKAIHKQKPPRGGRKGMEAGEKGSFPPGFENDARNGRHAFLKRLSRKFGNAKAALAHTADDQVETVLMRVFEGAGIGGLKGIPRKTRDGIERSILDVWREDILEYLKKHKISYRVDKSNIDTRFERNWIRHVLIPLLEKRYGKSVKKRIYTLGERFRELDAFIKQTAHNWLGNNNIYYAKFHKSGLPRPDRDGKEAIRIPREAYGKLPSLLRIGILQILCFERIGKAPNERLLASMDRLIISGGSSARLNVGRRSEEHTSELQSRLHL